VTIVAISRDLTFFSNRIAKFSNQIANRIAMFQIESFHLKSTQQNGSKRDLSPNRDWDLPITGSLWQILTLCRVYTVAFLWVSVFPSNFQVSEAL